MREFFEKIPLLLLAAVALLMALAPFVPEPHLWQKLKMLFAGTLVKPIDIFDLFWHSLPLALFLIKLWFVFTEKKES
jgi:hypothetical protein